MQCSAYPSPSSPSCCMASAIQCIFSAFICANISAAAAVGPFACASFDDVWPVRLAFASAYVPPSLCLPLAHGVLHLVTIMAATCRRIKRKYLRTPNAWWIQPRHDIWHILHTYRCMYIICTPPTASPSPPLGPFCNFPTIGNIRNSFCALCIKCIMYHPLVGPLSTPDPFQCLICFLLNRQSAGVRVCECVWQLINWIFVIKCEAFNCCSCNNDRNNRSGRSNAFNGLKVISFPHIYRHISATLASTYLVISSSSLQGSAA